MNGSYVQPEGEENLDDTSMSTDEMHGQGFEEEERQEFVVS